MRSIFRFAALAGFFALAACDQSATGAGGALTGTWRYRATLLHQPGSLTPASDVPCVEEYLLDITHDEGTSSVSGVTRPASHTLTCTSPTQGTLTHQFTNPMTVWGEIQDGRIHLVSTQHNFGEVHPSRIEGRVEGYYSAMDNENATLSEEIGTFVMERVE